MGWAVWGSNPGGGQRFVYSQNPPHLLWGPRTLILDGYRPSFEEVKQPGRVTGISPPYMVEVKNVWSFASTPLIRLWRGLGQIELLYLQSLTFTTILNLRIAFQAS